MATFGDYLFGVGMMSGQEIYDNFQKGAGAEGLATSAAIVNEVAKEYFGISAEMQRLSADMSDAWQGDAAGAAERGASPMLHEHSEAGIQLMTAQDLSSRQAGSFGDAKYGVVPVPPEPTEVLPWIVGSPEDRAGYFQQLVDHKQAAQHNVDVMNSYTGASTYNTDGMPTSYGELAADQAGITVGGTNIIDHGSGDTGDTGGHPGGPRGGAPGPVPGDDAPVGAPGPGPVTPAPGDTSGNSTTSPERHTPAPPGNPPSVADPVRPAPASGPGPGVGIGLPGPGGGPGGSSGSGGGRGGSTGAAPRGAPVGGPVPRGAGPGTGAQPFGPGGRGAPGASGLATGRGAGAGIGGMPMGAGRGGDEDKEHKRPAYLEADDPEGIFGTDVLTAPPVIGDEDDED